jgi:TolA-binding protein
VNSLPLFEFRTPSASIELRHAAKESFSDRGCSSTAAGPEPGDPFSSRGPKSEEAPQEDDLDQEIRNMEMLHQQVQRKKEKMARLAHLQRQIDEASEEVRHLAQDEQNRRPQHRELHQEGFFNEDDWYEDFHHGNFAFDDASPLSAELQPTPWPPSYKLPQLPMYDGHSDPKQFLMSYEATISLYGGNTAAMAKSFVMAVKNVAQTWYSSLRP